MNSWIYIYIYIYIYKFQIMYIQDLLLHSKGWCVIKYNHPESRAIAKHFHYGNALPLLIKVEKLFQISVLTFVQVRLIWRFYIYYTKISNLNKALKFLNKPCVYVYIYMYIWCIWVYIYIYIYIYTHTHAHHTSHNIYKGIYTLSELLGLIIT